ncbi:MAG: type 1 glutamine amidotransferase domain-containing protein [Thermoleophilia bacterium]
MDGKHKHAAVFLAAGFEDSELVEPVAALRQAGVQVTLVGMAEEDRQGVTGKKGTVVKADVLVGEVEPEAFDLLVIPGGKGPARLRRNDAILDFTRAFDAGGKPIAAICHGPQVLASAGLLTGRTATSYFTVAREIKKAGGTFVNKPVVVDGNLITSRQPRDIPVFIETMLKSIGASAGTGAAQTPENTEIIN